MKMLKLILAALTVVTLMSFTLQCSCFPPAHPIRSLHSSTSVFSGRVVRIQRSIHGGSLLVTFATMRIWKGIRRRYFTVKTCRNTACCGFPFKMWNSYLVYANGGILNLHVSLCSRTKHLSHAGYDIHQLNQLTHGVGRRRRY